MRQPLQRLVTVLALGASLPAWSADYQLVYSETDDRAGAVPLDGAVVSGDLFGRVLPLTGPLDSSIEEVRFYLDGSPTIFHDDLP